MDLSLRRGGGGVKSDTSGTAVEDSSAAAICLAWFGSNPSSLKAAAASFIERKSVGVSSSASREGRYCLSSGRNAMISRHGSAAIDTCADKLDAKVHLEDQVSKG